MSDGATHGGSRRHVASPHQGHEIPGAKVGSEPTRVGLHREHDTYLRPVRVVVLVLLAAYTMWGGMVPLTVPQAWTLLGVGLLVAVLCLPLLRGRSLIPYLLFVGFWGTLWLLHPHWSAWDPELTRVLRERNALRSCAAVSIAMAIIPGPTRFGVVTLRRVWGVLAASLAVMGVGEVVTRTHFSPAGPYAPPDFSPSGPFGNPNNFACVLVVGLGITLGRMSERIARLERVLLGAGALVIVGLIVLTLSRAAVLATVVIGAGALALAVSRSRHRPRLARSRWLPYAVLAAVGALVAAAPLLRTRLATTADELASDNLRLRLIRIALDHWRADPLFGFGGGRFETLLRDHHPEAGRPMPMHNTFIELLTEYGIVGFTPLALLLLVALVTFVRRVRPSSSETGRPTSLDDAGVAYLLFVMLVGIGLTGVVASSALHWPPWWFMIAGLTALTAHLVNSPEPSSRPVCRDAAPALP